MKAKKSIGTLKYSHQLITAGLAAASVASAYALTITEDFTKATTQNNWLMPLPGDGLSTNASRPAVNRACLTAGTGTTTPTATIAGSPPKCTTGGDPIGQGALRLTPTIGHHVGGIVSNFTFPTNEGVEINFTTYTWGGNGADGMTFFLADGDAPATLGASGGALGYPCSNENPMFSGVDHAYLGIGMDEWGNFINGARKTPLPFYMGDNTDTYAPSEARGLVKNTIGIRGAGRVNYGYLADPNRFLQDVYTSEGWGTVPASVKTNWINHWRTTGGNLSTVADRMRNICRSGNYTIPNAYLPPGKTFALSTAQPITSKYRLFNYAYLGHKKLANRIDPTAASRAAAKAMLYKIRITPGGRASVWVSENAGPYQVVIDDIDIVSANGPLPDSFRFGFMGATGGYHNNHEVTCFKASPAVDSQGDASVNLPDARVVSDTQIFLSQYSPLYWTGQLLASNLVESGGVYAISPQANWDAACTLNGKVNFAEAGTQCSSTGTTVTAQSTADRVFWSWNAGGITLDWGNLSTVQQNSLRSASESVTMAQQRLAYLKGDRSQEEHTMGDGKPFRKRRSLLGDIINSSPTWVAAPSKSVYDRTWQNRRTPSTLMPENSGQAYSAYMTSHKNRTHVVYSGSNDGFLHGFRAGRYLADNTLDTSVNDGREVLSYMPAAVLSRIHKSDPLQSGLSFSHNQYTHNYYNDAAPGVGDVFYQGTWHTWLLSGLGAGGSTVYALDVTNPDNFANAGAAAGMVKGEWSYNPADPELKHLGNTYGTPVFGRFHDGNWGAVFGNGWCSTTDANSGNPGITGSGNCTASGGPAGIYVMSINQSTGVPSFKFISTGESGTAAQPNGIAYVTPFDIDDDQIYDYAYAGDLKGNIWRFNLTANNASAWATQQPQKIFTAATNQPISTKVVVFTNPAEGLLDPIVTFGTGLRQQGYLSGATTYANSQQSIYGLRDKTARAFPAVGSNTAEITHGSLQTQTINSANDQLSNNEIDWTTQNGWVMNLGTVTLASGEVKYEQMIYNMHLEKNKYIILNSYIDGGSPLLSCNTVESSGYTYPLNAATGTGLKGFFDNDFDGDAYRKQYNGAGTPLLLYTPDGRLILVIKDQQGRVIVDEAFLQQQPARLRRLSWREIF